jgi:hypothetical protein
VGTFQKVAQRFCDHRGARPERDLVDASVKLDNQVHRQGWADLAEATV